MYLLLGARPNLLARPRLDPRPLGALCGSQLAPPLLVGAIVAPAGRRLVGR